MDLGIVLEDHAKIYVWVLGKNRLEFASVGGVPVTFNFDVDLSTVLKGDNKVRRIGLLCYVI